MRPKRAGCARRRQGLAFIFVLLLVVLGADGCANRNAKRALNALLGSLGDPAWGDIDPIPPNLRVHFYPKVLNKNDTVEPWSYPADSVEPTRLTCQSDNGCLLFFIDTDHWAHFAHKTVVALWELDSGRFQEPVVDEWWPLLNGEPIFDTVRKREDWLDRSDPDTVTTIVYPEDFISQLWRADPIGIRIEERVPSPVTPVAFSTVPGAGDIEDCRVWAVIVDGYKDEEDTFHIDTDGIYNTLRGHGVPDENIFYLCPDPGSTEGCDLEAKKSDLKEILTQDLGEGQDPDDPACGELLLFYSSHGGSDVLWCGRGAGYPQVQHSDLSDWLDVVRCANITVVVEACESGGLFDRLKTNVPANQTRFVFTSTARNDQPTYRDVDEIPGYDDNNPGDIGSETVWGYVEAFGTGSADGSGEMTVSFSEAAVFATANDITTNTGSEPGIYPGGLTASEAHSCAVPPQTPIVKIELAQETPAGSAGLGRLLRCRCNVFSATVSHPGGDPPPVTTARFYWTDVSDPTWSDNSDSDFNQVWDSTRILGSHEAFPLTLDVFWDVGSDFEAGTEITLLAIADSPHAPIPEGPMPLDVLIGNDQASALKLEVVNPSSCFIFPCGCRTVRCERPN